MVLNDRPASSQDLGEAEENVPQPLLGEEKDQEKPTRAP